MGRLTPFLNFYSNCYWYKYKKKFVSHFLQNSAINEEFGFLRGEGVGKGCGGGKDTSFKNVNLNYYL